MNAAGADFAVVIYSSAVRSFTGPDATAVGKKFKMSAACSRRQGIVDRVRVVPEREHWSKKGRGGETSPPFIGGFYLFGGIDRG